MTNKRLIRKDNIGLLYILPWIIGFLFLQLYPFVSSFLYSFMSYNILKAPRWIGLRNFTNLFTNDPYFWQSMKATFLYVAYSLPLRLLTALFVALLLNKKMRGIAIYRTAFYIPSLLGGSVAVAIVWRYMFGAQGPVNLVLNVLGISTINWLANTKLTIFTISLLNVWQFGASMVIFLAALKNIPETYYEAARVEGAKPLRILISITIPLIKQVIFYNFILEMIRSFQDFTAAFLITNGGPLHSTYLFALKLYEDAFTSFRIGYASAESWFLFVIMLIFTFVLFKVGNLWSFYSGGGTLMMNVNILQKRTKRDDPAHIYDRCELRDDLSSIVDVFRRFQGEFGTVRKHEPAAERVEL